MHWWEAEFHNVFEGFMNRFVKTKSKLLKNPYLEGVNLVFPYLDRRKSVFIDMVILELMWQTEELRL